MSRLSVSSAALGLGGALVLVVGCVEQAEEKPTAEDVEYVKKNLLSSEPKPQLPINADLDGKVVYLGVDVSPNPVEAGKDVRFTHYWKVVAAPGEGWRTFTHLNGPNHQGYVNADHGPVRGKYPVSQWKAGDIIKDEHATRLPPTWQFDKVELFVGLWRRQERMTIKAGPRDNEGRLRVAVLDVKGSAPPPPLPPKRYLARKVGAGKPIKLDGKLDEAAWKDAPSTGMFVNTLTGGPADTQTDAKLLWDDKNLYVAFQVVDSDVWSELKKRDDKLWTQEAVELMIDADGNGKSYVEFQVAPNGTIFDTYLPEYRKYEDAVDPKRKPFDWNSGLKAAVKVDGTLNQRDDEDKGWVAEIAIPLANVSGLATEGARVPPALGDTWRMAMYRLDSPKGKQQLAAAWAPPMVGDFHALDKFGHVIFADEKGGVSPPAPAVAAAKDALKGLPVMGSAGADSRVGGKLEGAKDAKKAASAKMKKATADEIKKN